MAGHRQMYGRSIDVRSHLQITIPGPDMKMGMGVVDPAAFGVAWRSCRRPHSQRWPDMAWMGGRNEARACSCRLGNVLWLLFHCCCWAGVFHCVVCFFPPC